MTSLTPILPAAGEAQLIPVYQGAIGGVPMQVCKAKDLHAFLEVGRDFPTWFVGRVEQYGFVQNQDFASFPQNGGKPSGPKGGRPSKDYLTSLDMAKELSMVENNAKGRDARRYFIAMERHALAMLGQASANQTPPKFHTTTFDEFFGDIFGRASADRQVAPTQPSAPETVELTKDSYIALLEGQLGRSYRVTAPRVAPVAVTAPGPRPVTPEEEAEVIERYTAGESKYAIGKALGRHGKTIDRILARANRAEPGTDDLFAEVQS